jgi:hypothetical protein
MMKKLVTLSLLSFMLFACNTTEKKEAATAGSDNDNAKALYEQHLAIVKGMVTNFENKDIDAFFANVSDTATWNSPAYGDTVHTKAHWRESLQYWVDNWDSLHLVNPIYLSGMNAETNTPDGSVRYYGSWVGVHKATGIRTNLLSFYEYFNFNADHKVVADGSFFDVGGLMNAVQGKK